MIRLSSVSAERNDILAVSQALDNMLQKANIITVLNKVGIEATLDKDGNLVLPDKPQVSMPEEAKPEVGAIKP